MVSLSYSLFSQQNTVQQNTVWEVVNFDETTVDRDPNIPFRRCNNLIMDKVTKEGFLSTEEGLMVTNDGGFNWEPSRFRSIFKDVFAVHDNIALVLRYREPRIMLMKELSKHKRYIKGVVRFPNDIEIFEYENTGYSPKGIFYKDRFFIYLESNLGNIWSVGPTGANCRLRQILVQTSDNNDEYFFQSRASNFFINNDVLYAITENGDVYSLQVNEESLDDAYFTLVYSVSDVIHRMSHYLYNSGICYVVTGSENNSNLSNSMTDDINYPSLDILVSNSIVEDYEVTASLHIKHIKLLLKLTPKDAYFVERDKGYVIGQRGNSNYIYSTNDGGLSWKKEYETEEHLNNLYSIDGVMYAIKERGLLMRDNSNGSWVPAYIPARTPDTLRSVWCMSGDHCIAVGSDSNTIYRTRNSTDWVKEELDIDPIRKHPFYQIFFKDELIGSISSGLDVVFNTTDGGNTWTLEYTTNPDIEPGLSIGISPNGNIKLMSCQQGSSTYMTTGLATVPPTIPAYNRWNDLNTIGYLGYSINSLQFKNDNTVYAVGNEGGIYIYDCYYDSYFNTDRVTAPYRTQLVDQYGYPIYNNLRSIKIHDNIAYTVGDRGIFCKIQISDPYQTPRVIDSRYIAKNENMPFDLYSIDFKTPNNIYTVGDNIILNSTDGGATWQQQKIIDRDGTITDNFPYKLRSVFVADNYVYAVGVGDVILRGEIIQPASPTPDDPSSGTPTPQSAGKQGVIIDNQNISLFYPNPADKYIEFTNLPDNAVVKIIDILGREVFHGKINGNRLTVENYENGMYSVVISDGNKVKTGKFMVQH